VLGDGFRARVVSNADGRIETVMAESVKAVAHCQWDAQTYPRGQWKLSSGLTAGTLDWAMKLPSTYTLAFPGRSVYSDLFLIFAWKECN
jgi:hypothetical protein